jgi:hypothetical protein
LNERHPQDVRSAAKQLYPYILAWSGGVLTAGALVASLPAMRPVRAPVFGAWLLFTGWLFSGKLATVIEVIAYTGRAGWLRVTPMLPVLMVVESLACCIASVTTSKAPVQPKGPRHRLVPADQLLGGQSR